MKKSFLALVTVVLLVLAQIPVEACGDKLLSMARAISIFKAYKPWKTASILI